MSTVLVDRYRVVCENCGMDQEFMVGAGRGDVDAVKEAYRIHAAEMRNARKCPNENYLTVMKLEVNSKHERAEGSV